MRPNIRMPLLIFCSLLFSLMLAWTVNGEATNRDTIQQLIDNTKQEITKQKKKEKSVLSNLLSQQQELDKLEGNYQRLNGKLSVVRNKMNITKAEQQRLEKSLRVLERNLSEQEKLLNRRLVATYKYGPQPYLEVLFQTRNFGDLINKFSMISRFIKNDLHLIAAIEEIKTQVNTKHQAVQEKKRQVESELKKITVLQDQVSKAQQKVASKVKGTKEELNKIQTDRERLEKALEEYEETSRKIEAQIRQSEGVSGEIRGTGKMIWPVRGRITSNFGWRYHPILRQKKYHNGLDIAVPTNTQVRAADDGVVVVSGWEGGYGNYVAIDHGNGISTGYGHNHRLLVSKGERVTKGQVIALSDSTGLSTGPHVHFEVRVNGAPANPIPYLP